MNKLDFLSSTRFWALVLGAVAIYLKQKGIFGDPEMQLIATITAGFTIVKTIDRNMGDTQIKAASVSSGQMSMAQAVDAPPKSE